MSLFIDNEESNNYAWIAGFINGDGSLFIGWQKTSKYRQKHLYYNIQIGNSERILLRSVKNLLGGSICIPNKRLKNKFRNVKTMYYFMVTGKAVVNALPKLIPFLKGIKKQKAKVMLKAIPYRNSPKKYKKELNQIIEEFKEI